MTAQEIWDELTNLRFNTQTVKLAQVKKWVSQAEIKVWNHADWNFKRMPVTNLTVIVGAATEPTDFGKAIRLYSPLGDELEYLPPDKWEASYAVGSPIPTGTAEAFTVIEREIKVGPTESGTFKLAYERRYTKRTVALPTGAPGVMSTGTDTPYWDSEHHYVLVPTALILGMKLEADPTAEGIRSERDEMLQAMVRELVPNVRNVPAYWGSE